MGDNVRVGNCEIPAVILQALPQDDTSSTALGLAAKLEPQAILNHSVRVYLLAKFLAEREDSSLASSADQPVLFTACILHDIGATDRYNGKQRFEVEGADVAATHLHKQGYGETDCHRAWCGIALHTSGGIAERIDPFTRLVRIAVKMDFSSTVCEQYGGTAYRREIEENLPRLGIEKVLADAVVAQAEKIDVQVDSKTYPDSQKHPKASWPGILLRAHLENPDHQGVNYAF